MRRAALLPLLLCAGLATGGCGGTLPLFGVEVQTLCKTQEISLAGFGGDLGLTELPEVTARIELPEVPTIDVLGGGLSPEVTLGVLHVTFTPLEGVSDFDFLQELRVELLPPPGSDLPRVRFLDYSRSGESAPGDPGDGLQPGALRVHGGERVPVFEYLDGAQEQGERARLELTFHSRELPTQDWRADARVCLYARASLDYELF